MMSESFDCNKKYRDEKNFNIGELIEGTKIPKGENGKVPWHNEINENYVNSENGLCVFCGKTSLNLLIVDIDTETLFEFFQEYLDKTFIVKTGKKGYHIYFRTFENPKSRSLTNTKGEHIDILGQGKIAVLPPTIHPETKKAYEIISDVKIKQLTRTEEQGLYQKLSDLGFKLSNEEKQNTKAGNIFETLRQKVEGTNRQGDLLSIACRFALKNKGMIDEEDVIHYTLKLNQKLAEPYPEDRAIEIGKSAYQYSLNDEPNPKAKIKTELKANWGIIKNSKSNDEMKDNAKQEINKLQEKLGSEKTEWVEEKNEKINKTNDLIDMTALQIRSELDIVTNRQSREILIHNSKIYTKNDASQSLIEEKAEKIIENCTTHDRNEVVNKIKAQTYTDIGEFDKDPNLISIDNGILDIEKIHVKNHTPKHFSSVLLPVEYHTPQHEIRDETIFEDIEKNLKDTLFWKFLKSAFTINDELRKDDFNTILEITASFFIKKQIDEKAFMFLGRGENGKSVLTEYIENMLGRDNIEKIQLQDLSNDKFMCAKLVGKLANIFSDLESDELRHTGKIKSIVSGEGLEVQEKYGKAFKLYPFCKLLFSCNRFPKVYDQSQGFFRRWIIIKWRRNFENDPERDGHLKDKLKSNQEEKNLVFSSLVYLARKLLKTGKFTHSKNWKDIQQEWNANADPLDDFVNNCIIESDGNRGVRETYHFYKQIMLSKQERSLGIGQFGKAFREYFDQEVIKKDNKKTERMWQNIDFKKLGVGDYDEE